MKSETYLEINLEDFQIKIIEESKYGIAGEIWSSAYLLSSLLIAEKSRKLMKNKIVLEVGSGTGICGLFASLSGAKKVYLTDREDNLGVLIKNYELNKNIILENNCEVSILPLDWNYSPHFKKITDKIDIIIASDIIYHGMNYDKIVNLLKYFSNKNNEILLAFTNRLSSSLEFFCILDSESEKNNWKIKKVGYDFLNLNEEILEKIKFSELYSLKYLN